MAKPPYDILFEPVRIGPKTTRNRFYQVPHCTGMGYRYPQAEAAHRGVKAEGGWGVVCTQETEIHPSSDLTPCNEGRLWDDGDIPALRLMVEAVQAHGALAAVQLVHNGCHSTNRYSRLPLLAPSTTVSDWGDPVQARAMDKADIKAFRGWHVEAAKRAKAAGFDIIYVYAGHDMSLLQHFMLARHNHRSDEYGGSFENRLRLFREVLADTKDAVGDSCAIAVRLAVDELMGEDGFRHEVEGRDIIEAVAEEPDLWDVNISDWTNDSQSSRFAKEGYQEPYTAFVKSVTTKPVVGVGRYTSPDAMVRLVKSGHLDLIGAARPSIADPFLPRKIEEGRLEDIRECIGCNICVSGDNTMSPMRCTQNPTVGEEWRRGWHPEVIPRDTPAERFLIVGGGPAGMEAARALVDAGNEVVLAEAGDDWGGRVRIEASLPGLAEWGRVRDWRLWQLQQKDAADLYLQSRLSAEEILDYGIGQVALATGASWRMDGVGRTHRRPVGAFGALPTLSVDNAMQGGLALDSSTGPVVIYDDDGFYIGSVLAELAVETGRDVVLVTPAPVVAPWTENTLEQGRIQARLIERGVEIIALHQVVGGSASHMELGCVYSGARREVACGTVVPVTSRVPNDALWNSLQERQEDWADAGIRAVTRIGDCFNPSTIAAAVHAGHAFAREAVGADRTPPRRGDRVFV